jgi:hypothetical protein
VEEIQYQNISVDNIAYYISSWKNIFEEIIWFYIGSHLENFKNKEHNFEWWSIFFIKFQKDPLYGVNLTFFAPWLHLHGVWHTAPYGDHFGLPWWPFWIQNGQQNTKTLRFGKNLVSK